MSSRTVLKGLERLPFPALIATAIAGLLALVTCAQCDGQVYRQDAHGSSTEMSTDSNFVYVHEKKNVTKVGTR